MTLTWAETFTKIETEYEQRTKHEYFPKKVYVPDSYEEYIKCSCGYTSNTCMVTLMDTLVRIHLPFIFFI